MAQVTGEERGGPVYGGVRFPRVPTQRQAERRYGPEPVIPPSSPGYQLPPQPGARPAGVPPPTPGYQLPPQPGARPVATAVSPAPAAVYVPPAQPVYLPMPVRRPEPEPAPAVDQRLASLLSQMAAPPPSLVAAPQVEARETPALPVPSALPIPLPARREEAPALVPQPEASPLPSPPVAGRGPSIALGPIIAARTLPPLLQELGRRAPELAGRLGAMAAGAVERAQQPAAEEASPLAIMAREALAEPQPIERYLVRAGAPGLALAVRGLNIPWATLVEPVAAKGWLRQEELVAAGKLPRDLGPDIATIFSAAAAVEPGGWERKREASARIGQSIAAYVRSNPLGYATPAEVDAYRERAPWTTQLLAGLIDPIDIIPVGGVPREIARLQATRALRPVQMSADEVGKAVRKIAEDATRFPSRINPIQRTPSSIRQKMIEDAQDFLYNLLVDVEPGKETDVLARWLADPDKVVAEAPVAASWQSKQTQQLLKEALSGDKLDELARVIDKEAHPADLVADLMGMVQQSAWQLIPERVSGAQRVMNGVNEFFGKLYMGLPPRYFMRNYRNNLKNALADFGLPFLTTGKGTVRRFIDRWGYMPVAGQKGIGGPAGIVPTWTSGEALVSGPKSYVEGGLVEYLRAARAGLGKLEPARAAAQVNEQWFGAKMVALGLQEAWGSAWVPWVRETVLPTLRTLGLDENQARYLAGQWAAAVNPREVLEALADLRAPGVRIPPTPRVKGAKALRAAREAAAKAKVGQKKAAAEEAAEEVVGAAPVSAAAVSEAAAAGGRIGLTPDEIDDLFYVDRGELAAELAERMRGVRTPEEAAQVIDEVAREVRVGEMMDQAKLEVEVAGFQAADYQAPFTLDELRELERRVERAVRVFGQAWDDLNTIGAEAAQLAATRGLRGQIWKETFARQMEPAETFFGLVKDVLYDIYRRAGFSENTLDRLLLFMDERRKFFQEKNRLLTAAAAAQEAGDPQAGALWSKAFAYKARQANKLAGREAELTAAIAAEWNHAMAKLRAAPAGAPAAAPPPSAAPAQPPASFGEGIEMPPPSEPAVVGDRVRLSNGLEGEVMAITGRGLYSIRLPSGRVLRNYSPQGIAEVIGRSPLGAALYTIRRLARDAGIPTVTKAGNPTDRRLLTALRRDAGIDVKRLEDLTPEQVQAAIAHLRQRAAAAVSQVQEAVTPVGEVPPSAPGIVWRPPLPPSFTEVSLAMRGLAQQVLARIRGRVAATGAATPLNQDQYSAVYRFVTKQLIPEMNRTKAFANRYARELRNFALHDYGSRYNFDMWYAWLWPWGFWHVREKPKWALRLATHPGWLTRYLRVQSLIARENERWYREVSGDKTGTPPPWWSRALRVPWHGTQFFMNIEAELNPFYEFIETFRTRAREQAPGGSLMQTLTDTSPAAPSPLIMLAYVSRLLLSRNPADREAARQWMSYLIPQSRDAQYLTVLARNVVPALKEVIPPGGFNPEWWSPLMVRTGEEPGAAVDEWTYRAINTQLARLFAEGEISKAEMEQAAATRSGPAWERARNLAANERGLRVAMSTMLGLNIVPRTAFDAQVSAAWAEYMRVGQAAAQADEDTARQLWRDFFRRYEWMTGMRLGRTTDPVQRLKMKSDLAIYGRLKPNERYQAFARLGISEEDLSAYLRTGGRVLTGEGMLPYYLPLPGQTTAPPTGEVWDEAKRQQWEAAVDAILRERTPFTPDDQALVDAMYEVHDRIIETATEQVRRAGYNVSEDTLYALQEQYHALPEGEERKRFLREHPELELWWKYQDEAEDALQEGEREAYRSVYETPEQEAARLFWEESLPPGSNWRRDLKLPPEVEAMLDPERRGSLSLDEQRAAIAWLQANVPEEYRNPAEWEEARAANEQFQALAAERFGEDIFDLAAEYGALDSAERRAWRARNREAYNRLKAYWDLKRAFGKDNPVWRKYYGFTDEGTSYGGGGGYRRGYRRYSRRRYYGRGGGGGGFPAATPVSGEAPAAPGGVPALTAEQYQALLTEAQNEPGFAALLRLLFGGDILALAERWFAMTEEERQAWLAAHPDLYARLQRYLAWLAGGGWRRAATRLGSIPPGAPVPLPPVVSTEAQQ